MSLLVERCFFTAVRHFLAPTVTPTYLHAPSLLILFLPSLIFRPIPLQSLTEKVDVYCMAMVCYAMLAGKAPYGRAPNIRKMKLEGIPPVLDPSWDPGFVEVSLKCYQRKLLLVL